MSADAIVLHRRTTACELRWGGSAWRAQPMRNGITHIAPGEMPRSARWRDANEVLCLTMEPELLVAVTQRRVELQPSVADDPFIAATIEALASDLRAGSPAGPLYGETLCAGLGAHLVRNYGTGTEWPARERPALSRHQWRSVLDYVEANLERVIALQELADLAGMSKFHFLRAFKRAFGMPPYRYSLVRRLERAKTLLRDPGNSVSEVALRSGFSSHSNFTTAFRSYAGVSPRRFRDTVGPVANRDGE